MKTVNTLIFNANVPTYYWGDTMLTTCILINRMSSSLENQISHSIIFPNERLSTWKSMSLGVHVFFMMFH